MSYLVIQIKLGNEFSKKVDAIEEEILSEWKTSFNKSIIDTMKKIPSIDFLDLVHLQPYTRTMIFTLPKFTSIEFIVPEIKKFFKELVDIMDTNYSCKIIGFMSPIVDGIKCYPELIKKLDLCKIFNIYKVWVPLIFIKIIIPFLLKQWLKVKWWSFFPIIIIRRPSKT